MSQKTEDLFKAFVDRKLDRRELMVATSRLGLSGVAAGFLLNRFATQALAQDDFNWKKFEGQTLRLLLNKHPYTDALLANLDNFKELTGMEVEYDVFPEDVYFDKVTSALTSGSDQYDVFMTGAYQTWQYGPAGWLVDLKEYINDPSRTTESYDWEDILPSLRESTAWSGVPGEALGGDGARQWALPMGFELNSVTYNKRIFDELNIGPPENMEDLVEKATRINEEKEGMYGIGVRGSRSWATIHPGYLSGLVNFGGSDFTVENGSLKPAMNSQAAKDFTAQWIDMIRRAGPRNWTNYTWYEVGNDLGAGASGMIYDADILGYFQNGDSQEAGNLAFHGFKPNPEAEQPTPNVWIWSLAMSSFSENKDAAWYFLQWATATEHTTFGATEADLVNPIRESVWDNSDFQKRLEDSYPGYLQQFEESVDGSRIYFTPQPLFFNLTTEWAASLQRMYSGDLPVDEGLDRLAESIMSQLRDAGLAQ